MIEEWWALEESEGDLHAGIRNMLRVLVILWLLGAFIAGVAYVIFA